ncbi:hypothetical protein [Parasitella parasitica]|uniref:CCHC-type domain-containing protein n=1 Tax=Parasitella parasitica TaxID=35722 RepID=A0A0B7N6I4_9FUNG|nr:hypothetical protein [Parasitella parasitica]
MIIDTSVGYQVGQGKWQEAKPLSRMLYLSKFDCFVPATYKGAPPICHFCHQSGHIRSGCPQLTKRRCFGCDRPGHIVRFCPDTKQSVVLDLEEVGEPAATPDVTDHNNVEEIPSGSESEEEVLEENPLEEVLDSGEEMVCESNDEEDEVQLACAAPQGSLHSKFAPDSVSLSMKVDPPAQKLGSPKEKSSLPFTAKAREISFEQKKRELDERTARLLRNNREFLREVARFNN